MKLTTKVMLILITWIILTVQILVLIQFFTKMADKVTKICMNTYRKLEKNQVLNIKEGLQIPNISEFCYFYNLQWNYVEKYISIQALIFLFVSSILNSNGDNSMWVKSSWAGRKTVKVKIWMSHAF
jgi:hypothetical protein